MKPILVSTHYCVLLNQHINKNHHPIKANYDSADVDRFIEQYNNDSLVKEMIRDRIPIEHRALIRDFFDGYIDDKL